MTRIETFKPEHLKQMDKDTQRRLGLVPGWVEKAEFFSEAGPCFTALADDKVIGCGGVSLLWPGLGEAWIVVTPLVYKYPYFFHKTIKKLMDHIIASKGLHRLQATVISDFGKGARWLEALGFKREGLMKKYDTEQCDHWRYARVM